MMDDRELIAVRREVNELRGRVCRLEMLAGYCCECGMPTKRNIVTGETECGSIDCKYQEALGRELDLCNERDGILRAEAEGWRSIS